MQRTIYECDRCHKQVAEGDERRGLELPPRWRQVFEGTNLTYELCKECGEAMHVFITQNTEIPASILKAANEMAFCIKRVMETYIPPLVKSEQDYRQACKQLDPTE